MYERFTDSARRALLLAQEEAGRRRHDYIDTGHLLLGLLSMDGSPGVRAIEAAGVAVDEVADQVAHRMPPGTGTPDEFIPFAPDARKAMELASREAQMLGDTHIATEHLLLGVMGEEEGIGAKTLRSFGFDLRQLRERVREPGTEFAPNGFFSRFTDRARRVMTEAQEAARKLGHTHLGTEHILLGLLSVDGISANALSNVGISYDAVRERLIRTAGLGAKTPAGPIPFTAGAKKALEMAAKDSLTLRHNYIGTEHLLLGLMSVDEGTGAQLVRGFAAQHQVRDEVIRTLDAPPPAPEPPPVVVGREREMWRIMQILTRTSRNNVLLVGEPGTGRTSIVSGLARRIARSEVPEALVPVRLRAVDITTAARETVEDPDRTVLFLDDVRAGDADALRALAREKPRIIAVTDPATYLELQDIGGYFQTVPVGEPSHAETVDILKLLRRAYEAHHQVTITDDALDAAVTLSALHIPGRVLPGKALEVLDEAGARVRIADGAARTVDARHIAELFADRAGRAGQGGGGAGGPSVDDRYIWAMS